MYFKKTRCKECNSIHDEMVDYCPFCGARNEENIEFRKRFPMTFIPWYLELTLALFGLFGFQFVSLLFSFVFYNAYTQDAVRGLMLINVASYLVFFILCLSLLYRYVLSLVDKFKIKMAYLYGLIGFFALMAFSISYGIVIQVLRPGTGEGSNQSAVIELVKNYPVIAIFVIGIIGPICEEVAYRIGLFTLLRRVHPVLAYVGTGVIFGLIHFDFFSSDLITELLYLPNYIFAGLCFSFLYERKGIAASTFAHILNNLASITMILLPFIVL